MNTLIGTGQGSQNKYATGTSAVQSAHSLHHNTQGDVVDYRK